MSYAIAAAGTGGHVFPGLAVGEALVRTGVPRDDVLFVGGTRLELDVYPAAGYPFLQVELRGLTRGFSWANLGIPGVVTRAVAAMRREFTRRNVAAVLGMGGYVTIPAAIAARLVGARLAISEQNAEAGLGNRVGGWLASRRFGAFPVTRKLRGAEWIGNPVRPDLADFDREALHVAAAGRYGLDPAVTVLGVFGGSLGAAVINRAVTEMVDSWSGPPIQILHLTGRDHAARLRDAASASRIPWIVVDFESQMEMFYAASDLVVARAGGAVAELQVTATPAVLVPGAFGSGAHQRANAEAMSRAGAAVVIEEAKLSELGTVVAGLVADRSAREAMRRCSRDLARPDAADRIAQALRDMHG